VRAEVVAARTWESIFRAQGMKNPPPDTNDRGFNAGLDRLYGPRRIRRKGSISIDQPLQPHPETTRRTIAPLCPQNGHISAHPCWSAGSSVRAHRLHSVITHVKQAVSMKGRSCQPLPTHPLAHRFEPQNADLFAHNDLNIMRLVSGLDTYHPASRGDWYPNSKDVESRAGSGAPGRTVFRWTTFGLAIEAKCTSMY